MTCQSWDIAVPDSKTVDFFAERGKAKCDFATLDPSKIGDCVARIVTPRVRQAARNHFGCEDLEGAELESQPTGSCRLSGSHWEQRAFETEVMTSYASWVGRMSAVTLAVFEDIQYIEVGTTA